MRKTFAAILLLLAASLLQARTPADVQTIEHDSYTTVYSPSLHIPVLVSWTLTSERAAASAVSRSGYEFTPDPEANDGMDTRFYSRSGYDRGHMCPAADNKHSDTAMRESFYLTNICPQDRTLNAGLWNELEQRCRYLARKYGTMRIECGPVLAESPQRIGEKGIAVPEAFFKAVLVRKDGVWQAAGFIMPNRALDPEEDIFKYLVTVDEIEKATGLDLFGDLAESEQKAAESRTDKSVWEIRNWKKH